MKRSNKGFTLIELLIVVVIIGILAAIAIPKFAATKERAYVATMKTDLKNLATSEEGYASGNSGAYYSPAVAIGLTIDSLKYTPSAGNSITGSATVAAGSQPGWAATASNKNTAKHCYMFAGGATSPNALVPNEGVVACDP